MYDSLDKEKLHLPYGSFLRIEIRTEGQHRSAQHNSISYIESSTQENLKFFLQLAHLAKLVYACDLKSHPFGYRFKSDSAYFSSEHFLFHMLQL